MLWKEAGPTDGACQEAQAKDVGRFNGMCSARYSKVVDGFAVEVREAHSDIGISLLPLHVCLAQDRGGSMAPALHATGRP